MYFLFIPREDTISHIAHFLILIEKRKSLEKIEFTFTFFSYKKGFYQQYGQQGKTKFFVFLFSSRNLLY